MFTPCRLNGTAMELRQLEILRAIAEEKHFGRAAQRLYLAQASVSGSLQRLEAELGVRLVHRTSRRVELTTAGGILLAETAGITASLERATRLARQAALGHVGSLRIGTNYPASRLLLLPLLERLRSESPDLNMTLREMSTPEQVVGLTDGDLDIGLLYGPVERAEVEARHLLDVPVVATVRPGHPLAGRDAVDLAEVVRFPYLTGHAGGSGAIQHALLEAAANRGLRMSPVPSDMDASAYLLQIETSDAVGFSSLQRGEQNRLQNLRLLRIGPTEPQLHIHVAWNLRLAERSVNSIVEGLARLATEVSARA